MIEPNSDSNLTSTPCRLYVFIIAGVAAGVGSAVGVLTLALNNILQSQSKNSTSCQFYILVSWL